MTITFFISIRHTWRKVLRNDDDDNDWYVVRSARSHLCECVCGCWLAYVRAYVSENCQVKAKWYNSHIIIAIIAQCNQTKFIILWRWCEASESAMTTRRRNEMNRSQNENEKINYAYRAVGMGWSTHARTHAHTHDSSMSIEIAGIRRKKNK